MSWQFANPALLAGLAALAIPVLIHLLHRRRVDVIAWGAMQFLELGERSQRRLRLSEALLLATRMLVVALVALALARPVVVTSAAGQRARGGPCEVVLVLDTSASMGRKGIGPSAHERAMAWARDLIRDLPEGSAFSVVPARERPRPLIAPLTTNRAAGLEVLNSEANTPRGSSDIPAAIVEALRLFEADLGTHRNPRDILIVTDEQSLPWRPDDSGRWKLLRTLVADFDRRTRGTTRLWALPFANAPSKAADAAVGPITLPRALLPPARAITLHAPITNHGPGPLVRNAELRIDGRLVTGSAQRVGPIPPGATTVARFTTAFAEPGAHVLSVRLTASDDPLSANDESAVVLKVVPALGVVLVDGDPGVGPLTGALDFVRAALAPEGDEIPSAIVTQIKPDELTHQNLMTRTDQGRSNHVVIVANVDRLQANQKAALEAFLTAGGGVLIVPGDRTDTAAWNAAADSAQGSGWLPARLGALRGSIAARVVVAHPRPASFEGAGLAALGAGAAPALADAGLFAYHVLDPIQNAKLVARLDTGDPWIIERTWRGGRVMIMSGPLDAAAGTLAVNPDFVPLVHELIGRLADPVATAPVMNAGAPLLVELDSAIAPNVTAIDVVTPTGGRAHAVIESTGGRERARLALADEPGVYRFLMPESAREAAVAVVGVDPREWDAAPLNSAAEAGLVAGWPLVFERDPPGRLAARLREAPAATEAAAGSYWQWLVLAALAALCLEIVLTRRLARGHGAQPPRGRLPRADSDVPKR